MAGRSSSHLAYVVFATALWMIVLPGILVLDSGTGVQWRSSAHLVAGLGLAAFGVGVVTTGARHLADAGIGLFGVRPGHRLVVDGPYAIIRNPIDMGTSLIAVAVWVALDLTLIWVIPVAALVSFVGGVGPYEDRVLVEEFGEEFREYRRVVRKWVPSRR